MGGMTDSIADGWDAMYQATPPWDTNRPQPALLAAAQRGLLHGRTLDVGCGTGEHVLMAASFGLVAAGMDLSATAIQKATAKARERGIDNATFFVGDVLEPSSVEGAPCDTVTDCGVFHVFDDETRPRYVAAVRELLNPGGTYLMLVFSDEEPPGWGPRRISQAELRAALGEGWRIESIEPATLEVVISPHHVHAWLTVATAV